MFSLMSSGLDFQDSLYRKPLFIAEEQHTQDKIHQRFRTTVPELHYFISEVHKSLILTSPGLQWHGRLCKYCSCVMPTSEQVSQDRRAASRL